MDAEKTRLPLRPSQEAPLLPPSHPPEEEYHAADEMPPLPISPPPIPWPRVLPSL